ncbi:MAG: glycoside hydrolase family 36 protein [Victivallales bacterium]
MKTQESDFVKLENGKLSFLFNGIKLRSASPAISILSVTEDMETILRPTGEFDAREWMMDTPAGQAHCRHLQWRSPEGCGMEWIVGELPSHSGLLLKARFHNGSIRPVRLKSFSLLQTDEHDFTVPDRAMDWCLMGLFGARDAGQIGEVLPSMNDKVIEMWKGFGMPIPFELPKDEKANDGHWRRFRDFVTLYTDKGGKGLAMAAIGAEADVDFDWRVDDGRCRLEIFSQMNEVLVEPGEWRDSETVAILAGPYHETVDALNRWIAASLGSRTHRGPKVGWCSWYDVYRNVLATGMLSLCDAVAKLRDRIPMDIVQIDDGYQRQVGDWDCNDNFPEGWKPVVKAIGNANSVPGIWVAPQAVHETVRWLKHGDSNQACQDGKLLDVHPDWFQRDSKGDMLHPSIGWGKTNYWLDPTHPGAQTFIRQWIRRLRGEGFRYFKIDFNHLDDHARWHDPRKTRLQAYRDLYRLYREEMGEDTYLLSCSGLTRGTIGFADASRIGPDTGASWRAPHPCCIQDCIRAVGSTAGANGVFYANDPDVTYTLPRGEMTRDEIHTWHGFVGLLGGLALISEPLQEPKYQTDESLRMLEILTPPAPEKGRSFWGGVDGEHRRFGFVAERPWETFAAAMVYNPADTPASLVLDIPQSAAVGSRFHAWSFWDRHYLGVIDNAFSFGDLAPHACKLLRLTAQADVPVIIGSDLHMSMGAADIADFRATDTSVLIRLTDAGARSGSLFLYSTALLELDSMEGAGEVVVRQNTPNVWEISIRDRQRMKRQVVQLTATK